MNTKEQIDKILKGFQDSKKKKKREKKSIAHADKITEWHPVLKVISKKRSDITLSHEIKFFIEKDFDNFKTRPTSSIYNYLHYTNFSDSTPSDVAQIEKAKHNDRLLFMAFRNTAAPQCNRNGGDMLRRSRA